MNVNFNGYGENVVTFIADKNLTETGVPVKMSASGTVTKCAKGDSFCGVCIGVRDGYASVQLAGYVKLAAKADTGVGYVKLLAEADGSVSASDSGREYLAVTSNATSVGIIL